METNMKELFDNIQDEGYVDIYFVPEESDGSKGSGYLTEDGIKYRATDDWEYFCQNRLNLDERTIQVIRENEQVSITGHKPGEDADSELVSYRIAFK